MNNLNFKISSALKNVIGKDLITDDFIAVFELVKNSYDAYATEVKIIFENNKIIIRDNGKGMSFDDLKSKWLFVAYSSKNQLIENNFEEIGDDYRDKIQQKRYLAGAKGIGRFSCDRLGQNLIIKTKKKLNVKIEKLYVNWIDFEINSETQFIDINVKHETVSANEFPFEQGTELEITNLSSKWDRNKILTLKSSLQKLINPFEQLNKKSINEFSIFIESKTDELSDLVEHNENKKVNGYISNFIFEKLNLKTTQITTHIINKGEKTFINTKIEDRGELIYEIEEDHTYSKLVNVRFQIFYLNRLAKDNFRKLMDINSVEFGSIYLFKNGFRVYPFGEEGVDLLGIDRRKQQGYNRFLGTRDIIGSIEIFDETNEFKETSSRDGGLVETEGYSQLLHAFSNFCLRRLEKYVVEVQWINEEDKYKEDISLLNNSSSKEAFSRILSRLTDSDSITVKSFNRNLLTIVESKLDDITPSYLRNLIKISSKTNDITFNKNIIKIDKAYRELVKKKEEAEKKAYEEKIKQINEEQKRREAELKARLEEERRIDAEKKAYEEKQKRQQEEQRRREAELKSKEEQLRRKDAELKAKEEEQKRKEAQISEQEAKKQVKDATIALSTEKNKNTYLLATRPKNIEGMDGLIHSVKLYSTNINASLELLFRELNNEIVTKRNIFTELESIKLNNDKSLKISELITIADFKFQSEKQKVDLPLFINEYLSNLSQLNSSSNMELIIKGNYKSFIDKVSILDITIIIDNFISNSSKANAKKMLFEIITTDNKLNIIISDDGKGVPNEYLETPDLMFELTQSKTNGSGIGLYTIKDRIQKMKGNVLFLGNNISLSGAAFKLIFEH